MIRISHVTSHYRDCDVKYEYNNETSPPPLLSCSVCISASSCVLTLNAVRHVRQPEAQQPSDATQASRHAVPLPSPPAPAAGLTGRPPHPLQRAVPQNTPASQATLPLQPLGPNHSVLFSHAHCLTLCLFYQEELELHFVPLKHCEHE